MKNRSVLVWLLVSFVALIFSACDKSPQVFSVNNFRTGFEENGKSSSVIPMPVKGLTGIWIGLEHKLKISPALSSGFRNTGNKPIKDTSFFIVELIDTLQEKDGFRDTTSYDLAFFSIAGQQYIEVVSPGTKIAAHDFMLPISTYLKLNKLTKDTIIIQMPDGRFTEAFLKSKGIKYFIPYESVKDESGPIYLTENPEKLAQVLKSLYLIPEAFQRADTIIRDR
jgi:hypothetical protein